MIFRYAVKFFLTAAVLLCFINVQSRCVSASEGPVSYVPGKSDVMTARDFFYMRELLGTAVVEKELIRLDGSLKNRFIHSILRERNSSGINMYAGSAALFWNVSGPYSRYGRRDMHCDFIGESLSGSLHGKENIDNTKKVMALESGRIYPLSNLENPAGIFYLSCTVKSDDPFYLRVNSHMPCRVFVNGREVMETEGTAGVYRGVFISGAVEYTIMIKFRGSSAGDSLRVILSDPEERTEVFPQTDRVRSFRFTFRKIDDVMTEYRTPVNVSGREDYLKGNYAAALDRSLLHINKGGEQFYQWEYYIKSLIRLGRDREAEWAMKRYRELFPFSGIAGLWKVQSLSGLNDEKFVESMNTLHGSYVSPGLELQRIRSLINMKKFDEAVKMFRSVRRYPGVDELVMEVLEKTGRKDDLRRFIIRGAAETGRSIYFYRLGVLDLESGLDPVPYWKMAIDKKGIWPSLMAETDLFENGISDTKFHTPFYLDKDFEKFKTGARRKIRCYYSGDRLFMEVLDTVSAAAAAAGTYSTGFDRNISMRYALKISGKVVKKFPVTVSKKGGTSEISFSEGAEEGTVFAFKYTVEVFNCFRDYPGTMREVPVFTGQENFERLNFTFITRDSSVYPFIGGVELSVRSEDNRIIYETASPVMSLIRKGLNFRLYRFSGYESLSEYISGLAGIDEKFSVSSIPDMKGLSLKEKAEKTVSFFRNRYTVSGKYSLNPRMAGEVEKSKTASAEEILLLMRAALKKTGINSYMAYDMADDGGKPPAAGEGVYLYVPEDRGKGWFIDIVSGEISSGSGRKLIVFRNGYRIFRNGSIDIKPAN